MSTYRNALTLAADHYGCPTSIDWLCATLGDLLAQAGGDHASWLQQYGGLYHVSMLGYASRVEVADHIVATCKAHGLPITLDQIRGAALADLPATPVVPGNCKLDPTKFAMSFDLSLPRWQDELRDQVGRMLNDNQACPQVA